MSGTYFGLIPKINIEKKVLGSAEGQKVEDAEDSLASDFNAKMLQAGEVLAKDETASVLKSYGIEPTMQGVAAYFDNEIDDIIENSALPQEAKDAIKEAFNSGFKLVESKLPNITL